MSGFEKREAVMKTLPVGGLVERSSRVREDCRQLAGGKIGGAYALVERSCAPENLAVHFLRIYHAHGLGEVVSHHFNRRFQVGVSRNEHRAVVFVSEGIKKHVRGNVDIRAFLFRLDDTDERPSSIRVGYTHHDWVGEVAAEDALSSKSFKCAKVYFLTEWLAWVVWARENTRSEVLYPDKLVLGREDLPRHCENVKPFVRSPFQCAVVEVESVNINYCSHQFLSESESRPFRNGPAPVRRSYSGVRWCVLYQIPPRGARGR